MKHHLKITIIILFWAIMGCNKADTPKYPDCLQPFIDKVLESEPQNPKASIAKYIFQNQSVYLLNFQNYPDGQSAVWSEYCESLCDIGGIDGTLNDCVDFDSAEFVEIVWIDSR